MHDPPDGELMRRVHERDPAALEALYHRHAPYVLGLALRILRSVDDAEEVLQEVFWQLWKTRLRYDPARGRFTTWLYAVARNRALDRLRRRPAPSAQVEPPDLEWPASGGLEEAVLVRERRRVLDQALAELPDEQRRALLLAFFEGLTHREISARLGEPLGTVKGRIRLGMERLRVILKTSERES